MSSISTAIRLNDQMSGVFRSVMNSINMTVSAMDDLDSTMDSAFDDYPIKSAKSAITDTEYALRQLDHPISRAEREQRRFNKSLKQGDKNAVDLYRSIMGVVGTYVSVRAITNLLSGGFDVFVGFEQSMARVGALSGATEAEFQKLNETAKMLGETTAFSAAEAADGMGFLAQAGFNTNEIIAAMPGLLSAAAASQMELGQTADIVSNILQGFGLHADE